MTGEYRRDSTSVGRPAPRPCPRQHQRARSSPVSRNTPQTGTGIEQSLRRVIAVDQHLTQLQQARNIGGIQETNLREVEYDVFGGLFHLLGQCVDVISEFGGSPPRSTTLILSDQS